MTNEEKMQMIKRNVILFMRACKMTDLTLTFKDEKEIIGHLHVHPGINQIDPAIKIIFETVEKTLTENSICFSSYKDNGYSNFDPQKN